MGTAKTPVEGVSCPRQIGQLLEVRDEACRAPPIRNAARADVAGIHAPGGVAVVAGGSGLYQRALLDVIEFPADPLLRTRLEEEAAGPLGSPRHASV